MTALIAAAIAILSGLSLQLAMVVRLIEPSIAPALFGYGVIIAGMALTLRGTVRRIGERR
jgi:urea transporter